MPRLSISLLGTFQVTLAQQPLTRFRSVNNQALLVYLAMERERALPRDVLATLFWPEEPDETARNNLRQALYRLRKLLGDTNGATPPYLLVNRQTAQFNPESDYTLDAGNFLQALEAGNLEAAIELYQGDLWPGFACDSLQFEEWLRQEREGLHHLALEAMAELTEDYLRHGHLERAQGLARRQLGLEPWSEPARRQLMRAYALAGDRANALAQFEGCREVLHEELGVEPSAETAALFEEIREGRYGPASTGDGLRPPGRTRHNLPTGTTPFLGRELELAEMRRLLNGEQQRLVTLVGPGGMGKTRLAVAAGLTLLEQYPDGVYFVDLAPLRQPKDIAEAIAVALEYHAPDPGQEFLPQLLQALSQRKLLLILDNFDHLLAGATVVNDILRGCPHIDILATSRQRLNLSGENRYELGGLDFPGSLAPEEALESPAVQLFADGCRRARTDFVLTEWNVADVVRICQLVQGMPLALVLAAAWLEMLTPAEIAVEIEESLDFLAADLADLPPRQRSMQAVFERSWQMLTQSEQTVLARLSVFQGGFTREAGEKVAGANLRLLLSLVNKSLLQRQRETGRFVMHELLRQFAARQRAAGAALEPVALAHCRYFSGLFEEENRYAFGCLCDYRGLSAEVDNVRPAWNYAVDRGLTDELEEMVMGVAILTANQGREVGTVLQDAIQALRQRGFADTHPAMLRLRLTELKMLSSVDPSQAHRLLLDLVPVLKAEGATHLCYLTYTHLAFMENLGGLQSALGWAEKACETAAAMEDAVLMKMAQALSLWYRVDFGLQTEATLPALEEMLAYFEPAFPDSFVHYGIRWSLAAYCLAAGDYEAAMAHGRRALGIAGRWRDLFWISRAVTTLADIHQATGATNDARTRLLDAVEWHLAIGQEWQTLGLLWSLAVQYPELLGGREAVVPVLAAVYHHPEAVPGYREQIEAARCRFEEAMGVEAFAEAWERGKGLDFDGAVAQMRGLLAHSEAEAYG